MDRQAEVQSRMARGQSVARIARELGVSRSTVYRELGADAPRKGARAAHCVLNVRLTEAELAGLDRVVARQSEGQERGNRSAFVRRLIRMAADMPTPSPEEEAFLASIETHLVALSGNFNQIARELSASRRKIGEAQPHHAHIAVINDARDEAVKALSGVRRMMEKAQIRNAQHIALMQPDHDAGTEEREAEYG